MLDAIRGRVMQVRSLPTSSSKMGILVKLSNRYYVIVHRPTTEFLGLVTIFLLASCVLRTANKPAKLMREMRKKQINIRQSILNEDMVELSPQLK
jgi:hypothetical protein